ncbi:hypothetical protein BCE_4612 [Bacillus cereus ATCC 10987]|uniref:Uncharacterized protein n=1 Tax=Bacillus cereus (strain ATCC 10987 / NRS 248) TaxID=222523 RepID=Q72ZQ6_BACC1|nr:hypothetical protein BCE_4612 [Bacillus cereus ATCC 10987]
MRGFNIWITLIRLCSQENEVLFSIFLITFV